MANYDIKELDKLCTELETQLNENQKKLFDNIYNFFSSYLTEKESKVYELNDELNIYKRGLRITINKLISAKGLSCEKLGLNCPNRNVKKEPINCQDCLTIYMLNAAKKAIKRQTEERDIQEMVENYYKGLNELYEKIYEYDQLFEQNETKEGD